MKSDFTSAEYRSASSEASTGAAQALGGIRPGTALFGIVDVREVLGEGGMGVVYRVRRRGWRRDLAMKIPRIGTGSAAESLPAVERECHTWAGLPLHPQVTCCHFVQRYERLPIIFIELVEGGSLLDGIASGRVYAGGPDAALPRMLRIAWDAARGLAHAHANNFVHQDVKPGNILLTDACRAKVTDFGLARAASRLDAGHGAVAAFAGLTPAYCSPEQAARQPLGAATDVWSWAATVLELFQGERTWAMGPAAPLVLESLGEQRDATAPRVPPMPPWLRDLLAKSFSTAPQDRPAMEEIASAFRAALDPGGVRRSARAQHYEIMADANNRGVAMAELGRLDEAERLLKDACESASSLGESAPLYNYALLRARWRHDLNAADSFSRAANASSRDVLTRAGLLQLELGQPRLAAAILSEALKAGGAADADVMNALAIALLLSGESQPARLLFEETLRLDPGRLDTLRNLALARYVDGNATAARRTFHRLLERSLPDAHDLCSAAVVCAAAGYPAESGALLQKAASLSAEPLVRFASGELRHGVQSFLPGVIPVADAPDLPLTPPHVIPQNLRAAVDIASFPSRYGPIPGAIVRDRQHILPDGLGPARLAGALASSFRLMTAAYRWGDLGSWPRKVLLFACAGVPAAALAFALCRAQAANGSETLPLFGIVLGCALLCGLRDAPYPYLVRGVLLAAPAVGIMLFGTLEIMTRTGMPQPLGLVPLTVAAIAVLTVWQWGYQRLTRHARALPHYALPRLIGAAFRPRARASAHDGGHRDPLGAAATAYARRKLGSVGPAIMRKGRAMRSAFFGWYAWLLPQAAVGLAGVMGAASEESAGYLGPLVLPAIFAPFAPHILLRLNTLAAAATGMLALDGMAETTNLPYLPLAIAAGLLYANLAALHRCPALAPLWTDCRVKGWDVRDVVDPLQVRRRAAPWALLEPETPDDTTEA